MLEYITNLPQLIVELFKEKPWGQTAGMVAFIISIVNFWFLKNRQFIWWTLFASLAWWINFFLMWAFAAAYINFIDVFKNWAALAWEKSKKALVIFLIIYVFIGIWQFTNAYAEHWLNITTFIKWFIPTFTALLSTYLVFRTTGVKMKAWFLIVVAFWLAYNIYFQNIGWILTDVSLWFMWIFWIWKDLKEERKK